MLPNYPNEKVGSGFAIFFFVQNVDEIMNQAFLRGHTNSTEPTPAHGSSVATALAPAKLLVSQRPQGPVTHQDDQLHHPLPEERHRQALHQGTTTATLWQSP